MAKHTKTHWWTFIVSVIAIIGSVIFYAGSLSSDVKHLSQEVKDLKTRIDKNNQHLQKLGISVAKLSGINVGRYFDISHQKGLTKEQSLKTLEKLMTQTTFESKNEALTDANFDPAEIESILTPISGKQNDDNT